MTNAFLAECDALCRDAFADVGLAEGGERYDGPDVSYIPAGSSTQIPCTLLIDRGVIPIGINQSNVSSPQTVITAYRDQIGTATPVKGARFVIGTETFTFDSISRADESLVACVVKVGS